MGLLAIGIATDICRYRSFGGRRHYRLIGVIRRFGRYAHVEGGSPNVSALSESILTRVFNRKFSIMPSCVHLPLGSRFRKRFTAYANLANLVQVAPESEVLYLVAVGLSVKDVGCALRQ